MSVHITIRDVPVEVRDKLAGRAAGRGQSLQDYLRHELERLAGTSSAVSVEEVLNRIRARKANTGTRVDPDDILAARDKDRR